MVTRSRERISMSPDLYNMGGIQMIPGGVAEHVVSVRDQSCGWLYLLIIRLDKCSGDADSGSFPSCYAHGVQTLLSYVNVETKPKCVSLISVALVNVL